ncbi:MAG: ferredoxin--NADP reductase [Planctomycetaceae bacterium]
MAALDVERLRNENYNAAVESVRHVHEELMVIRVRPELERPAFVAGQYTLLGLGAWEPRNDGVTRPAPTHSTGDADTAKASERKKDLGQSLIRRAYSISCPLIDDLGRMVTVDQIEYLEFFITLVRKPTDEPPVLTPRLFALGAGDRLFLGPHPHGRYTLEAISEQENVIFIATGTGEAPHNAMIAELLARGHGGRIFSVVSVRERKDLAYLEQHREIERRFSNYRYIVITTREPENLDRSHPNYVGKVHVQDYFATGRFQTEAGGEIRPENTHLFLCGNPMMIGLPHKGKEGDLLYPEPAGMVETLTHMGYQLDEPRHPGNVHFEKYW